MRPETIRERVARALAYGVVGFVVGIAFLISGEDGVAGVGDVQALLAREPSSAFYPVLFLLVGFIHGAFGNFVSETTRLREYGYWVLIASIAALGSSSIEAFRSGTARSIAFATFLGAMLGLATGAVIRFVRSFLRDSDRKDFE